MRFRIKSNVKETNITSKDVAADEKHLHVYCEEVKVFNEIIEKEERDGECKSRSDNNKVYGVDMLALPEILMLLSKYPIEDKPFDCGDLDYKWWVVFEPTFVINNTFSDLNSMLRLYNNSFISCVRKFGHMLFGIRGDRLIEPKHIALAFPEQKSYVPIFPDNSIELCLWLEGKKNNKSENSFGYWVIGIECDKDMYESLM